MSLRALAVKHDLVVAVGGTRVLPKFPLADALFSTASAKQDVLVCTGTTVLA